jgi:uncharacterized tellurite resistance protein B-like protein
MNLTPKSAFMTLFESKQTKEHKSHLMNLITLCCADGEISPHEVNFIMNIGINRLKMSKKEIEKVLKKPSKVKFSPPKDNNERFQQLWDMILLMFADGKITQDEMDFCITMATKLGFRPTIVDQLVKIIVDAVQKGQQKEKVKSDVEVWMHN